jgi:aryl-alcohol dehydrogenase-like predicted oxidoreductase
VRYRDFGATGWKVSEIAFGGWQLGGDWGVVDDRSSIDTLLYAFESGINFVDTAELYGHGHSEEVIGAALRQWTGEKIYVATKAQPTVWPDPDDEQAQMRGRYPEWHLRHNVEQSLRRLGVERLDLFQLHAWIASGTQQLDWLETLNELRLEGKVDQIGVSIHDFRPNDGIELASLGLVASQQVIFNMFEQTPVDKLFPAGTKSGTAFIARVPLDSGSLVGNWNDDTYSTWKPGSVPHAMFGGERFATTLRRVRMLNDRCTEYFPTLAEAAMRYVLSQDAVSTVIPGMTTRAEVDLNTAVSDSQEFPAALALELPAHRWVRNYYRETAR